MLKRNPSKVTEKWIDPIRAASALQKANKCRMLLFILYFNIVFANFYLYA
jgi:hypothetical protein